MMILASFDWQWLVMPVSLAIIAGAAGGLILLIVWATGGLHDG